MNTTLHKKFIVPFLFIISLLYPTTDYAQILAWDANNNGGGFGVSPWTPSTRNANLQTSGLVRGSGISTSGSAAGGCWGGSGGWSTSQSDSNSFYFTFQATAGYKVSLSSISTATRRSNSGPSGCIVYYSVGGGPFTSVATWSTSSTSGTTGTPNSVSLSGISALQNIAAGVVVKFRIIPQGSTGNYYLTGGTNSLKIDGSVTAAVNPLITPSTTSLASFGDVMVGNSSSATSFTFNGAGLTEDVSILAPTGFEISTDGINWYPGTDISPVGGTLNNVQIWVRFSPAVVGTASGNIVLSSPGATDKLVTVTGTGIPAVSSIVVDDEPYGPYCNGISNTFDLDFTPAGSFNSANFYAQLSNTDGTFPITPTNIVGVSATSPITVTIPADTPPGSNYRVRVYNDDPLTFSNNDNGHNITITGAATLSAVTQTNIMCDGGATTINLSGLIPESTSSISYTINNGTAQNVAGIIADISGNASFTISLPYSNNGHSLVIGTIERTDISSCPNALTANNSVVLVVNPSPTVTAVSTTPLCATNGNAVISLTGLIANSTSEITYTIAGGTAVTVSGITANASGEADFEVAVSTAENGRTLEITSIKRTDVTPDCESVISGISTILVINSRPTAAISGDQSVCQGSASSELNIALTGTAPWTITYTDGTSTFPITNIQTSPYTFTVTITETKTYTVTAVEDANCIAQAADMSGSATITVIETGNGGTITGNSTVCFGTNNGTLTLENHVGTIIKWQSSTVADFSGTVTDIENTAATLNYTNLSETAYYRAVVQNAPCTEIYSTIATITVNQTEAPTTAPQTFCNTATVANLQPNTVGIQWYDTPNGGTALSLTQPLTNGDYYATMTVDGCESARTLTSVTLNTVTPPTTTAHAFCNTATVADLQPNTAGIQWYDTPNGGTALSLTQPLTNGDYYATMTVDGCESARTLTSVTINTVTAPNGSENQNFTEGETLADLEVTGTNLEWYATETAAEAGTPVLDSNEPLVDGATYYAVQTVGECSSSPLAVTVSIVLGNPEFDLTTLKAYPNPVTDLLTVSYSENILAVEVFNLIGQKIMDKTVNNTLVTINLSDIETGTYLVSVSSGKAKKTFRILKKIRENNFLKKPAATAGFFLPVTLKKRKRNTGRHQHNILINQTTASVNLSFLDCAGFKLTQMKLQKLKHFLIIAVLALFSYQDTFSQCFQIESILVDACGVQEGLNEMVRFKVGNTAINTSNMSVSWPNNPWQGLIRNSVTAAKVATLNADILDAGGCGQLIEPTGGVLPANASVILVTSHNFDTDLNSFGALTDNVYIIFQNNPTTASGHFANSGTGIRTLTISFGSCSDTVSYDRALLIDTNGATVAADGAIVQYTPAGAATYINNGCSAPVPPFTVDAGPDTMSACAGTTISLNGIAQGYQSVRWSATSGTFSTATNLSTTYTSSASQAGTVVVITLTATNSCGLEIRDTINLTLTNSTTPNFPTALSLCTGTTAPVLNTTSPNGISGTWNPAVISNTASGNYVFTPNAGQCASGVTLSVTVTNSITPNFPTTLSICTGSTAPVLNTTSPNGITGTWNPAVVSNTANGNYVFTPNAGQCATNITLSVTVSNSIVPNFPTAISICTGSTAPVLNATSPNGITGTWNPAVVSNTASGNYVFTPNAGQCASNITLSVTRGLTVIVPNFPTAISICTGSTAPVLNTTSPNGITGTWNPAVVSNTANGSYVFTPNAGQCASNTTLNVTVSNSIIPNFPTSLSICSGTTAPALNATSPNGITGTWNPAVVSNTASGNYVFTPNAGQCATNVTLSVSVTNSITPNFPTALSICTGSTAPVLNTTSPNGVTGTWNPAVVSNTASGSYVFTPNAGQCAPNVTLNVTVANSITPSFPTALSICTGSTAPVLNTTSPNGITGTWNPAVVSNTTSGSYVFTPNAGQCATNMTLNVTVSNSITPNFPTSLTLCSGSTAPVLNTTSPNGITGTWNPAVVSNATSGSYVFTPNTGQCATSTTLNVTVTNSIIPDFATELSLCNGDGAPALATTSPNGITGTWNPAVVSNTTSGSYVFTPNTGQCASNVTLNVTVGQIDFKIESGCEGGNYMLTVTPISDFDSNDANYEWKNNQGIRVGTDSSLNVTELLNSTPVEEEFPITYTVQVTTARGCTLTREETVYGIFCSIPKGISPNNDGKNDEFDLSGLGVKELTIFNRYGVKVYGYKNYTNQWKGQSDDGKELPDATYYYAISKSDGQTVTGWVYLNRQR